MTTTVNHIQSWMAKAPVRITAVGEPDAGTLLHWHGGDWAIFALVLLLACLVRVVFYTGPMGSDDAIYTDMAVAILHGDWKPSIYVGALRYGINLPVAGLMALFGTSEFNANLWALLCSCGEVATVFILARRIWGRNAAILSALVLGLLPLHVSSAGRLLADSPLTFFVTLCFALFYVAEQDRRRWLFFATGLALGSVYWIKESVAALVIPVFVLYALATGTFRREWLWAMAGAALMLLLNILLMWSVSNDPWLTFHTANAAMGKLWNRTEVHDAAFFYFRYMFLDGRHTWLMPFLALGGVWVWWRSNPKPDGNTGYIVLWAAGLLGILSFTVVSLSPLLFIPKQSNYMQIFAAPMSLLAGYYLAHMSRRRWLMPVLFVLVSGSLLLCAMEQQTIRVFVANSRAALAFQTAHPGVPVYGSGQAENLSTMASELDGHWPSRSAIRPISDLNKETVFAAGADGADGQSRLAAYAIVDQETASWNSSSRPDVGAPPACWKHKEVLTPRGFGVGQTILGALRKLSAALLPQRVAQKALQATEPYYLPRPADVYEIPTGCRFRLATD